MAARSGRNDPDAHAATRFGRLAALKRRRLLPCVDAPERIAAALRRQGQAQGECRACRCRIEQRVPTKYLLRSAAHRRERFRIAAAAHDQLQLASVLCQTHHNGTRRLRRHVRGVAHEIDEQVEQAVRIALQVGCIERGFELEIDPTIAQDTPFEGETGANDAHRVEPLRPERRIARGARLLPYRPQKLRCAIDIFEHLTEIVEQREPAISGEAHPPTDRLHRELQPGATRCERVAGLVRDEPCWSRISQRRTFDQPEREPGELEGQPLAATALVAIRWRRGRPGADGRDDPQVPARGRRGNPHRSYRNGDLPPAQGGVEIEARKVSARRGIARGARNGFVRAGHFPQRDRPADDGARLAEHLAGISTKHLCTHPLTSMQDSPKGIQGYRGMSSVGWARCTMAVAECAVKRYSGGSMTPSSSPPSRPSAGRSSFAVAMKDYTFIRPGVAVTISALTLSLALVIGLWLIFSLRGAAATVARGAHVSETLHRYNAGVEIWREMATGTDPGFRRIEAVAQRDSLGRTLRVELADLANSMTDERERDLVQTVLDGLTSTSTGAGTDARQAMMVLLAKQDSLLFHAAQASQQAVLLSAMLLALTIIAAGMLIVPMAWLYVRYKQGAAIEVKV